MNRGRHPGPERRGAQREDDPAAILTALKQERARVTALVAQVERLTGKPLEVAGKVVKEKRKTKGEIEAERDAVAKEKFHQLHTYLLGPANMLAQMTCAAIFLNPGPLLEDASWAEGVRFFVYAGWGYAVPALWFVCRYPAMLSKAVKATFAWILLSVIGIGAMLAYFDR